MEWAVGEILSSKRGHDGNDVLDLPLRGVLGGVFARASAATIHGEDGEAARQNGVMNRNVL